MTEEQLDKNSLFLDWSSKDTSHQCLRKYFLRYLLDLIPENGSSALRYGSAWHACLEGFYGHIKEHGWTRDGGAITAGVEAAKKKWEEETRKYVSFYDDYRSFPNLCLAFTQYIDHFVMDENHLEVISVEQPFKIPMSPEGEEKKRFPYLKPFWFTGIMDMEIYYDGRYWQLDHKTTGQSISLQASRLQRSAQSIGYFYAGQHALAEPPEGHFISIHHLSAYKSKKTGEYGSPKIEFQRVPMLYSQEDIISWRYGFMEAAQRLQIAIETDNFPCEHGSCYTYGRCGYADICDRNLTEEQIRDKVAGPGFSGFFVGEHWNPAKDL